MSNTIAEYLAEIDNALSLPVGTCNLQVWEPGPLKWITLVDMGAGFSKGDAASGYSHQITWQNDKYITGWAMHQFPGCCAFCISSGVYVSGLYRNKGVNKIANRLRQALAKADGYTALICTDVDDNEPERRTLAANNWQDIFTTVNRRTGNRVNISIKMLE
jgi:hypothetical protein